MKTLSKLFTGLVVALTISLNANATFGPETMSVSDSTGAIDMAYRSTLLLAVSDNDETDDVTNTNPSNDDTKDDDGKNDDSRDDDGRDDDGRDDDSKDDDGKEDKDEAKDDKDDAKDEASEGPGDS